MSERFGENLLAGDAGARQFFEVVAQANHHKGSGDDGGQSRSTGVAIGAVQGEEQQFGEGRFRGKNNKFSRQVGGVRIADPTQSYQMTIFRQFHTEVVEGVSSR